MKFTSPFKILLDAIQDKTPDSTTCFIDETEVALKECGLQTEDKQEEPKLDFWDQESEERTSKEEPRRSDEQYR